MRPASPMSPGSMTTLPPAARTFAVGGWGALEVKRGFLGAARGAAGRAGLPDAERRPGRVGADRHAPRVPDVARLHDHAPAGGADLRGGLVGIRDPDIGVPDS